MTEIQICDKINQTIVLLLQRNRLKRQNIFWYGKRPNPKGTGDPYDWGRTKEADAHSLSRQLTPQAERSFYDQNESNMPYGWIPYCGMSEYSSCGLFRRGQGRVSNGNSKTAVPVRDSCRG